MSELEAERLADTTRPPKGTEDLVQGEDLFAIKVTFISRDPDDDYRHSNDKGFTATIEPTWNEIFAAVAPVMINEATDRQVRNELGPFLLRPLAQRIARTMSSRVGS